MSGKKYEILTDSANTMTYKGHTLHRIKALRDVNILADEGEIGGWIEKEYNLSQKQECWVGHNAMVFGDARILNDALIYGDAKVYGNAVVDGFAHVCGEAEVSGNAYVYGGADISGNAIVKDDAEIYGIVQISGHTKVDGKTVLYEDSDDE